MSSWFSRAFGYGLGSQVGKVLFGSLAEDRPKERGGPTKQQTEAEIPADEKRYDEEARRLEAESGDGKTGKTSPTGSHASAAQTRAPTHALRPLLPWRQDAHSPRAIPTPVISIKRCDHLRGEPASKAGRSNQYALNGKSISRTVSGKASMMPRSLA